MADLEEHALKRDRRFLVRLLLAVLVGAAGGAFLYATLTGSRVGGCAAETFEGVTDDPEAEEAPVPGASP
ncbi:MAG: hypothetical protein ACODAU_00280 [Myxococcota bacterium]